MITQIFDWLSLDTGMEPEILARLFEGWATVPYIEDGVPMACALLKGTEIHFAVAPVHRKRLISRRRARAFLAPLLKTRGYLTTRIAKSSPEAKRDFVTRMNFRRTWTDDQFDYYMLTQLPFERAR